MAVALGDLNLAGRPMLDHSLPSCLGQSFGLHHPPPREDFGLPQGNLLVRAPMQVSLRAQLTWQERI